MSKYNIPNFTTRCVYAISHNLLRVVVKSLFCIRDRYETIMMFYLKKKSMKDYLLLPFLTPHFVRA